MLRGATAIADAGAIVPGPEKVHPASWPPAETGVHAGRPGLICCVSVGAVVDGFSGMLMKWTLLSPAVDKKKIELSGVNEPAIGAVIDELPVSET